MIYVNITTFVLIILLEKDHSMIETCYLKNVVIFSKQIDKASSKISSVFVN